MKPVGIFLMIVGLAIWLVTTLSGYSSVMIVLGGLVEGAGVAMVFLHPSRY